MYKFILQMIPTAYLSFGFQRQPFFYLFVLRRDIVVVETCLHGNHYKTVYQAELNCNRVGNSLQNFQDFAIYF